MHSRLIFWDIDDMADAIYGLLHYEALSKMFIKYGRIEVENMKWDFAAQKVKSIYEEMIAVSKGMPMT